MEHRKNTDILIIVDMPKYINVCVIDRESSETSDDDNRADKSKQEHQSTDDNECTSPGVP